MVLTGSPVYRWVGEIQSIGRGQVSVTSGHTSLSEKVKTNKWSKIVKVYLDWEKSSSECWIQLTGPSERTNPKVVKHRLEMLRAIWPHNQYLGYFSHLVGKFTRSHFDRFYWHLKKRQKEHKKLLRLQMKSKLLRQMKEKEAELVRLRAQALEPKHSSAYSVHQVHDFRGKRNIDPARPVAQENRARKLAKPGGANTPLSTIVEPKAFVSRESRPRPATNPDRTGSAWGCLSCHRDASSRLSPGDPYLCDMCNVSYMSGEMDYRGPVLPSKKSLRRGNAQRGRGRRA